MCQFDLNVANENSLKGEMWLNNEVIAQIKFSLCWFGTAHAQNSRRIKVSPEQEQVKMKRNTDMKCRHCVVCFW